MNPAPEIMWKVATIIAWTFVIILGVILFMAQPGCAGSEARAIQLDHRVMGAITYTDAQCQGMLSARRTYGALGAGAAFAGGSGGITTAFPLDGTARYAIGGASLAIGITGAVLMFLSNSQSEDFNRFCTVVPRPVR